MNSNPLQWSRVLSNLASLDYWRERSIPPAVGVPVASAKIPPGVKVPLRAVLREAFLAGNREAPLLDALAEVDGWTRDEEGLVHDGTGRCAIVVPVRGAHDALRLSMSCLAAHTPNLTFFGLDNSSPRQSFVRFACAAAEVFDVSNIAGDALPKNSWSVDDTPAPQSFAANVNLGASRSRSEFIVLLNSDAFVGPGWLDALLATFADQEVVAVGPMGTNVSGHQYAPAVCEGRESAAAITIDAVRDIVPAFADARKRHAPYGARRLVGFCVAVRRSAWDRVGGMDEQFANAFCDDDLSLRLSLVGKCVVVPDLLVLHAGQASFAELPDAEANYARTIAENQARFLDKWGWLLPAWNAWMDARGWR